MNGASFDSGPSLLHIPYGKEELKMTTVGYQYAAASHISCHFWSGGLLGSLGLVSLLYCFTSPPLRTRVAPYVPIIPISALRLSFFIHTHTHIYTHSYTNTHTSVWWLHTAIFLASSVFHLSAHWLIHSLTYSFICRAASKNFTPKDDSVLAQNALESILQPLSISTYFSVSFQLWLQLEQALFPPLFLLSNSLCHLDTSDALCLKRMLPGLESWGWLPRKSSSGRCKVAVGSKEVDWESVAEKTKYLKSQPKLGHSFVKFPSLHRKMEEMKQVFFGGEEQGGCCRR